VQDTVWRGSLDRRLLRPLPSRLGVSPRGKSLPLQRALTDFGADESFGAARAKIKEHYGLDIGAEAVRTVTLEHAQAAQLWVSECSPQDFRALPAHGSETLVCEADGSFLRLVPIGIASERDSPQRLEGSSSACGAKS